MLRRVFVVEKLFVLIRSMFCLVVFLEFFLVLNLPMSVMVKIVDF